MKLLPILILLTGCQAAETFVDAGPDGTGGGDTDGGGGDLDLRPWTGTVALSYEDVNGNGDDITVDVTWTATTQDEDGVDYEPSGTITIARHEMFCTVAIDPDSHAIAGEEGYLRWDTAGTYRGFGGSYWDTVVTSTCPPNPPTPLSTLSGAMWLNAATPRPVTGPDLLAGDETMGAYHYQWSFTRE